MAVVIVVVVLLAVGAGIAFALKARRSDGAGIGPNEILQSPPSSFPTSPSEGLKPAVTPVPPGTALPAGAGRSVPAVETEREVEDEPVVDRFRAPGSRVVASTDTVATPPVAPRYPLEPTSVVAAPPEPAGPQAAAGPGA